MTSRYHRRHYEDISKILNSWAGTIEKDGKAYYFTHLHLCSDFADLFEADNPSMCIYCDCDGTTQCFCNVEEGHEFVGGFDRDKFLDACGLGD